MSFSFQRKCHRPWFPRHGLHKAAVLWTRSEAVVGVIPSTLGRCPKRRNQSNKRLQRTCCQRSDGFHPSRPARWRGALKHKVTVRSFQSPCLRTGYDASNRGSLPLGQCESGQASVLNRVNAVCPRPYVGRAYHISGSGRYSTRRHQELERGTCFS